MRTGVRGRGLECRRCRSISCSIMLPIGEPRERVEWCTRSSACAQSQSGLTPFRGIGAAAGFATEIVYADPADLTKMLDVAPGTETLDGVRDFQPLFFGA